VTDCEKLSNAVHARKVALLASLTLITLSSPSHAATPLLPLGSHSCSTSSNAPAPTPEERRAELIKEYPSLADDSRPENRKILCPFHRLLERTGMYDSSRTLKDGIRVAISLISRVAAEFGCSKLSCGGVATAVSAGQITQGTTSFGKVNVEALHTAVGIAHDCGLTFEKGGQEVSDRVRDRTLSELKTLADASGRLTLDDLRQVQLNRCNEQGGKPSQAGLLEGELIYTFLGGNDRGYIMYEDVVLFLHALLPSTIGVPTTAKK
jgi:hypothetical protein